jgi:hypothetical protein
MIEVVKEDGQYVKNLLYMESLTSVKYHCMANVIFYHSKKDWNELKSFSQFY